jgi:hypothetical protein
VNPYTARRLFNSPTQEERRVPGRMPQIKRTVPKPVVPRSWGIIANPYPISVSEEECILKRACLSVWFNSFTGCIHKQPDSKEVLSNGTEAS